MNNKLEKYDNIVIINGIGLMETKVGWDNSRAVICKSNKVNKFIIDKNLDIKKLENNIMLSNLLQNNYFDDIEVIEVKGYY
jgi:hypothetical protein